MAKRIGVDKWDIFHLLTLVVVGLAMVFSASAIVAQERFHSPYAFVGRQAGWALAGVLLMVFLMSVDYAKYNTRASSSQHSLSPRVAGHGPIFFATPTPPIAGFVLARSSPSSRLRSRACAHSVLAWFLSKRPRHHR